jgi:hypothetical protein
VSGNRALTGLLAAGLWLLLSPVAAAACPACYESSSSSVLMTYYWSAVMLTLLPFAIIGTIVIVARHLGRQAAGASADGSVLVEDGTG